MNGRVIAAKVLLTAMLLVAAAALAKADERIPFERGALEGNDWTFFRVYLDRNYPMIVKFIAERQDLNRQAAQEFLRRYFLYSGRYDINGDGIEELFVSIRHGYVCGITGCNTVIFERQKREWHELAMVSTVSYYGLPELHVSDEVIDGYRTLYSEYYGLRWNGEIYDGFCRRDCTEG